MTYKTGSSTSQPALQLAGVADRKEDTPPGVSANEEKVGRQWVAAAVARGNSKPKEDFGYNQR